LRVASGGDLGVAAIASHWRLGGGGRWACLWRQFLVLGPRLGSSPWAFILDPARLPARQVARLLAAHWPDVADNPPIDRGRALWWARPPGDHL